MEFPTPWTQINGKVSATFEVACDEVEADEITMLLGVMPTETDIANLPVRFTPDGVVGGKNVCVWTYETSAHVSSANISDHVRHLVQTFVPLKSRLVEMRPVPRISVRVVWAAAPGFGFQYLAGDCVAGLAELNASLKIDPGCMEETPNA